MFGENCLSLLFVQAARKRPRPPDHFGDLGRVVPPLCDHCAQISSSSLRVPILLAFSQPSRAATPQNELEDNIRPKYEDSIVDSVSAAEINGIGGSVGFWRLPTRQAAVDQAAVFANENVCFNDGGALAENFGTIFDDNEAAALVDEFSNEFLFFAPLFDHTVSACHVSDIGHQEKNVKQRDVALAMPAEPVAASAFKVPSLRTKARALTKFETAREYRKNIAIPRYLAKRAQRNWNQGLMHPSRSEAAKRRPRNGGQFGVVTTNFVPAAALRHEIKASV